MNTETILLTLSENQNKLFLIRIENFIENEKSYYLSRHILGIGRKEITFNKSESQLIELLISQNQLYPIYKEFQNEHISCQAFQNAV